MPDDTEAASPIAPASNSYPAEFDALLDYLKLARGFDFTGYKRASLERRVLKRMQSVASYGASRAADARLHFW